MLYNMYCNKNKIILKAFSYIKFHFFIKIFKILFQDKKRTEINHFLNC